MGLNLYGTDSGPACSCGSTVYGYTVYMKAVAARCIGCNKTVEFKTRVTHKDAKGIRFAHELYAVDPTYWGSY